AHEGGKLEGHAERGALRLGYPVARAISFDIRVEPAEVLGDELYRLERVVAHRARGHEAKHARDARRRFPPVPARSPARLGVGRDDEHASNLTVIDLAVDAPRAVLSAQGDIRAAQADVVGEPAVEEVHERPVLQI